MAALFGGWCVRWWTNAGRVETMTNLEQRIHDLAPDAFARSAHAAADLAIRAAALAGKQAPVSAVWLKKQSSGELSAQQRRRLHGEAEQPLVQNTVLTTDGDEKS